VADLVEVFLELRNVAEFVSGAKKASGAMGDVGEQSEKSGKKIGISAKSIAKWAAGAGLAYGAYRFIKSAVSGTQELAKSTLTLQRSTNLDTQAASEWVGVLKQRGISTTQFQVGLAKLSKTMETSRTGTQKQTATIAALRKQIDQVAASGGKKAPAEIAKLSRAIVTAQTAGAKARETLKQLGVSQQDIAKGNTKDVLDKVANAMKNMHNHAQRLALAQSLFGRSGRNLIPILSQGAAGVRKLLDDEKKAGNYLTGSQLKQQQKQIIMQRQLNRALEGFKTQLGVALMPVILAVTGLLTKLAKWLQPITSRAWALKLALAAIAGALIALKIATIAQAAAAGEVTMATKLWTIAQWLLNAALDANPIVLVIAVIVALGVAIFIAYKKSETFRRAVKWLWDEIVAGAKFVWNWIKANWPLLIGMLFGPFGVAAALIITHFGEVKKFVLGIIDDIRTAFDALVSYLKQLPSKLVHGVTGIAKSAVKHIPGVGGFLAGHLADGGVTQRAGAYLVGERGPEIVGLPNGANVQPIAATTAGARHGHGDLRVVVPVMIDGREIARATARVTADKLARR
jgi:phage-related protein